MSDKLEDTLRDVLTERVERVVPPPGWEYHVLDAGRARRKRRRAALAGGVAAAVAVVGLSVTGALSGWLALPIDVAGGPMMAAESPRVAPSDLPRGRPPDLAYTTVTGEAPPGDTVETTFGRWTTGGFVSTLEQAGDALVAVVDKDRGELVYRGLDGRAVRLDRGEIFGVAVSADGTRVAWAKVLGPSGGTELKLATLPGGEVVESRTVQGPVLRPAAFVRDKVLLDYDLPLEDHPYARTWDPATGRIDALLEPPYAGKGGQVLDIDPGSNTVLLLDSERCVHNVSLADAAAPERWTVCESGIGAASLSPDGRLLAGITKNVRAGWDALWIRHAASGELVTRRMFSESEPGALVWESPDAVLFSYADVGAGGRRLGKGNGLIRCTTDLKGCARARTATDHGVGEIVSRQGTELPTSGRAFD